MLPEQVLSDGGHIERLPMYHSRALDVLLPLDATADRALQALVRLHLPRLADSLAAMTHPDGGTALLNDSAFGVYPPPPGLVAGRDDGSFYCPEFGIARPNPCLALSSTVTRLDGTVAIEAR